MKLLPIAIAAFLAVSTYAYLDGGDDVWNARDMVDELNTRDNNFHYLNARDEGELDAYDARAAILEEILVRDLFDEFTQELVRRKRNRPKTETGRGQRSRMNRHNSPDNQQLREVKLEKTKGGQRKAKAKREEAEKAKGQEKAGEAAAEKDEKAKGQEKAGEVAAALKPGVSNNKPPRKKPGKWRGEDAEPETIPKSWEEE